MSKMATKAADNVFYKARMVAAKWNDKLSSREGASEVTGLDRTRIAYIELGTINPYPEEILILADCYNAPELCNHYCANLCPIGRQTVEPVEVKEGSRLLCSGRKVQVRKAPDCNDQHDLRRDQV